MPIPVPLADGGVTLATIQALIPFGLRAPEAFGSARSSVSRRFIRSSARASHQLQERRHDAAEWLVLLLDGKTFAADQMVIALGVTVTGKNRLLGMVQTATENQRVCAAFLSRGGSGSPEATT